MAAVPSTARLLSLPIAAILAGCGGGTSDDTDSTASEGTAQEASTGSSLTLDVIGDTVIKGDLVLWVNADAVIKSDAVASLKLQTEGNVLEVYVRPGDRVRRGQPLVKLDPEPLELALEKAEAALRTATARYQADILPDSIVTSRPPLESRRQFVTGTSGLESAEIGVREARLALQRSVLLAPFDGVIEKVGVSVGERASSGQEAAVLVDITNLRVEAKVQQHNIPMLSTGGDAQITVAGLARGPIRGRIATVLPLVDSTNRTGTVVVRVQGDGIIRPGMFARVTLEADRLKDRIIVPERAIVERTNRPLVFAVRNGIAEWVYIERGQTNGIQTEILPDTVSGIIPLKPGETVLVGGHLTMVHQAPVRVVNRPEGQ